MNRKYIALAIALCGLLMVGISVYRAVNMPPPVPIVQTPGKVQTPGRPVLQAIPKLNVNETLASLNQLRAAHNLGALALSDELSSAAMAHARDITTHDDMDHTGSDGTDPWDRAAQFGFAPVLVGEGVFIGSAIKTNVDLMTAITTHPDHKEMVLDGKFTHVGLAKIVLSDSMHKVYWVVVLASK